MYHRGSPSCTAGRRPSACPHPLRDSPTEEIITLFEKLVRCGRQQWTTFRQSQGISSSWLSRRYWINLCGSGPQTTRVHVEECYNCSTSTACRDVEAC